MIAALVDILTSPDLSFERYLLAGSLLCLAILIRLIVPRLDVLPLVGRWCRRRVPRTVLSMQPYTPPRRPEPSATVVDIRKGRTFGTSRQEYERLERRRLSPIVAPWTLDRKKGA